MGSGTYQLNAPAAIAEDVDGEVIAMNLATGVYFSFTGWSAWAWNALVGGSAVEAVKLALARSVSHVAVDLVDTFVEQLMVERLIVESSSGAAAAVGPPPDIEFAGLPIERYTDMEDLILLDPVHDVDASEGWPRAAAPNE